MQALLLIAAGGALGAVLRFAVSSGVYRVLGQDFPYGTLVVNVLGSLLAGLFFCLIVERGILSVEWRSVVIIGLLGAFTTFSAFSVETWGLLAQGELGRAALNIMLNVALCLAATWLGLIAGRQL